MRKHRTLSTILKIRSGAFGILAASLLLLTVSAKAFAADGELTLLKLVPVDMAATLSITDLRGHVDEFMNSSLVKSFQELPTVKAWFDSEAGRKLSRSKIEIEKSLGMTLKAIRDDLLGDAIVFGLHLAADAPTESARGLFLAKVRDRALLTRLIDFANKTDASIAQISEGGMKDRSYTIRRFKPGEPRETEYYRLFDDGIFAWSNSETLIQGVLDRKSDHATGLADDPLYQKTRAGLPARALMTLSVHPQFLSRVLAPGIKIEGAGDKPMADLASQSLGSIARLGLAIEWRNGFVLHAHEVLDTKRLDPRFLRWAKSRSNAETLTRRIPGTAIAATAIPIDFEALFDAVVEFIPGDDRPRFDTILVAIQGVLLGRDVRKEVIPQLGPALIGYVEEPGTAWPRFPIVGVLELRENKREPWIAHAIDNGLRTLISLSALDPKSQASRLRLVSHQTGTLRVTSLADPSIPFAYGVGPDVLIVATSADAVARFGLSEPDSRLGPFKKHQFADARAYAALDVTRLVKIARVHRDDLANRFASSRGITPEAAKLDLNNALALVDLFGGAFLAITVEQDMTSMHQSMGLIAK